MSTGDTSFLDYINSKRDVLPLNTDSEKIMTTIETICNVFDSFAISPLQPTPPSVPELLESVLTLNQFILDVKRYLFSYVRDVKKHSVEFIAQLGAQHNSAEVRQHIVWMMTSKYAADDLYQAVKFKLELS